MAGKTSKTSKTSKADPSGKIEITREVVLDYLVRKGYREGLEGTKKLAEFVYLCYESKYIKGEPRIDYGAVAEKVAKKFKCEPGSITQNTRYLCVTKFPNKSRSEVINHFLEELALLAQTNRTTVLSGSRIEYFEEDARLRNIMMYMVAHDIDVLHPLDIYIERPEYNGILSPFYEIGIMDAKQSRIALKNPSALTTGDGARNQRMAAIYYCFEIIRFIYKETNLGNTSVMVRPYCDVQTFYQGPFFDKLSVE